MMKKKKKTIGEMTNSRMTWSINPTTRIVKNKKGKGSYSRTKLNYRGDREPFFHAVKCYTQKRPR